ncbi:N-acetylated-alpha-linked acidic dipeptidase 2 isoform X1 [Hydra vulgaris]|uniref:N-acetylated-alpha-linked acidic dipeptidase 2 isoform X1 n=1 Tax=Hydra vulgaris TaxID=6087 RepID=UPI001F5E7A5A|nr:N-acetylated-alpha-linked acidic dipeptidase 2 isoform X1 [Hydra vulgaris]
MDQFKSLEENNKKKKIPIKKIVFVIVALFIIFVAFLLGYVVRKATTICQSNMVSQMLTNQDKIQQSIVASLDRIKLQENLRFFASKPHMASFEQNNLLADEIFNRFKSYGFKAEKVSYSVLLSFPSEEKENAVSIMDLSGKQLYKTNIIKESISGMVPPFNAYSPNGTVEAEPVYANYGRLEDFDKLKELNISCSGKIVIVRYGKGSRANKVELAEKSGALGVVIFSDPKDYGPVKDDELFPKSKWMPRKAIQRGSIKTIFGDSLTPSYPAKDWVYRIDPKNAMLPKIPSQPISAFDAFNIMKEMDVGDVPNDWNGMLNITYRLSSKKKVKVEVNNQITKRTITNIVGTIVGNIEPDRYVMIGNHRDSWIFGAADPGSGTSVMMEIARALGEKMKDGWRPMRTIKFFSWDGEEQGLIGSNEYVEEFQHELRQRGVAYLNVDTSIYGNGTFQVEGSGLLRDVVFQAAKLVQHPHQKKTLFEDMVVVNPDKKNQDRPKYDGLASGSDYAPFYSIAGVTCADFSFGPVGEFYPTYHTEDDTLLWMENFTDPGYKIHLAVSQAVMHVLLKLSNSPIIPFNPLSLKETLDEKYSLLQEELRKVAPSLKAVHIRDALNNFTEASLKLKKLLDKDYDTNSPKSVLLLRMLNDITIQIEKTFLRDSGLVGRENIKNYIYAPSAYNRYGSSSFPSVVDSLFNLTVNSTQGKDFEAVKKELTLVALVISSSVNWIENGLSSIQ